MDKNCLSTLLQHCYAEKSLAGHNEHGVVESVISITQKWMHLLKWEEQGRRRKPLSEALLSWIKAISGNDILLPDVGGICNRI
jgi:hypothetical protein